jgi:hypothetical protein
VTQADAATEALMVGVQVAADAAIVDLHHDLTGNGVG